MYPVYILYYLVYHCINPYPVLISFRESTASVFEGSSSSSSPDPVVVAAGMLVAGCAACVGICVCRYYLSSPSAPASSVGQGGGDKPKAKTQHNKGTTYESVEMDVFKDGPEVSAVYLSESVFCTNCRFSN